MIIGILVNPDIMGVFLKEIIPKISPKIEKILRVTFECVEAACNKLIDDFHLSV